MGFTTHFDENPWDSPWIHQLKVAIRQGSRTFLPCVELSARMIMTRTARTCCESWGPQALKKSPKFRKKTTGVLKYESLWRFLWEKWTKICKSECTRYDCTWKYTLYIYYIMYYNLHVPTPPILPLILESAHSCGWGTCLFKNMRKDFCSILDSWMIQPKPAKSEKGTRCYWWCSLATLAVVPQAFHVASQCCLDSSTALVSDADSSSWENL